MPAPLMTKDEVIERLFKVFRDRGFEGTSLADLSNATGLGKSSLYHYFPRGKEQMAEAVLLRSTSMIDQSMLEVAKGPEPLKTRARKIIAALEELYEGGTTLCLLGQLASANISAAGRHQVQEAFSHWTQAIAIVAAESGMSPTRARHFAEDWLARLQGALVLQAANSDTGPFKRAMAALLDLTKEGV